jgi:hypothetical protein
LYATSHFADIHKWPKAKRKSAVSEQIGAAVTLYDFIRKMFGLNLGHVTDYIDLGFVFISAAWCL